MVITPQLSRLSSPHFRYQGEVLSVKKSGKIKKKCLEIVYLKKYLYICTPKSQQQAQGEVPEWSIGPHSKCGVRATVPGVRIPPSPQRNDAEQTT